MSTTFSSTRSRIHRIIGPMVILIGIGAAIAAIVLMIVMEAPAFLALLIPAALAIGGGTFILWGARRSRLQIDSSGFTWCGFVGKEHSLRWEQLHQLLPPPPGAPRVAAIAQLRDGSLIEVRALWESPTSPRSLAGGADLSAAQNALLSAHRHWLSGAR